MRVLKFMIVGVIAVSVLVFWIGAFLSKDFRVERSIDIDAPPEAVFGEVNSLRRWDAWSPWIARDATLTNSYSGPDEGVGASVAWTSEGIGSGTQTITLSEPHARIETLLDFGEMGQPRADWTFEPNGAGTRVTWGMTGTATGPLGGYWASMMDDMLGSDYEEGLQRLKVVVESKTD